MPSGAAKRPRGALQAQNAPSLARSSASQEALDVHSAVVTTADQSQPVAAHRSEAATNNGPPTLAVPNTRVYLDLESLMPLPSTPPAPAASVTSLSAVTGFQTPQSSASTSDARASIPVAASDTTLLVGATSSLANGIQLPSTHTPATATAGGIAAIFLPTPSEGFPAIHAASPTALTQNIEPIQLRDWLARPSATCAAVQVYGFGYPSRDEAKIMVDRIRAAIVALTKCQTAEVAAPIAARGRDGELAHPLPATFLAFNLTEAAASELKNGVCWSTRFLGLFLYDFRPSIPEYLFALHGFTHRAPREIEAAIKRTLMLPSYRDLSLSLALDNPEFAGQRPQTVFDTLLRSIRIKVVDLSGGPLVVHVYCKSPTTEPDRWCMWRDALGDAEYYSSYIGVGFRGPTRSCSGCHGSDHLRTHCPYARLPGWGPGVSRGPI